MKIEPIRAFQDNYIWLLHHGDQAAVVDPGDATPVRARLKELGLTLTAVLITHHHGDHVGGLAELAASTGAEVFGPAGEDIAGITRTVKDADLIELPGLGERLQVLEVPGHTRGHVAYYGANALFCGDTLFAGGCGRLFEGSPAQMWHSLQKLAALPGATRVYCAHEYTESNLRFALAADPHNPVLAQRIEQVRRLRAAGLPSLPSRMSDEHATNPFLRCGEPMLADRASGQAGRVLDTPLAVFTALREWKNHFA